MTLSLKIFLSTVSAEFRAYRDQLRSDLTRHNVEVKVQEDFNDLGGDTLDKLDVYIASCDVVVHLVGDMLGFSARETEQATLLAKYSDLTIRFPALGDALRAGPASYTQWEAWLALYHRKALLIAMAADCAPRGGAYLPTDDGKAAQAAHLGWLKAAGRYPSCEFTDSNHLGRSIAYTVILDELAKVHHASRSRRPQNLPFASLGPLFKGRATFLKDLHAALVGTGDGQAAAIAGKTVEGKAVHGLGGVGKTRLAVEYAYRHEREHTAVLFVPAETPALLATSLAALAGPDILDLPEKDVPEDAIKIPAALGWLDAHPGWLMILDNVDDEAAAKAVLALLQKLRGGHVLITSRLSNFAASIKKLPLDVLAADDAAAFLLERTADDRQRTPDDAALALTLAEELGGLALGLEQAGAYIATQRIGFARYIALWRDKHAIVVDWFDKDLMSYNHDTGLAATWATSVDRLTPDSRRLLDSLAFFAPEPIPDTLLDVAAEAFDRRAALAGLYAYSLVAQAQVETGKVSVPGFAVHRLVQNFTRRVMTEARRLEALREALAWVDVGFEGHPSDFRIWPMLDPLASHTMSLADAGEETGVPEPTGTLLARLGTFFQAKARYADSESAKRRSVALGEAHYGPDHPELAIRLGNLAELLRVTDRRNEAELMVRRALAIDEASFGPDHPNVAIRLNNIAGFLRATNRLGDAEPMYRRALAIGEASFGPDHLNVGNIVNNLASLLQATNRLDEAEPMYKRALAIDEASYGPDHPNVAIRLNNLAGLLRATNRLGEAEPMYRRALLIGEASYEPYHPNLANFLNNLASLLEATNRLDEAEPMFRRALAIDEASYGPDHPNVANRLNNLAGVLRATNRLGEAEPMVRRALAIFEASLGPDHPNTIVVRKNLELLVG